KSADDSRLMRRGRLRRARALRALALVVEDLLHAILLLARALVLRGLVFLLLLGHRMQLVGLLAFDRDLLALLLFHRGRGRFLRGEGARGAAFHRALLLLGQLRELGRAFLLLLLRRLT